MLLLQVGHFLDPVYSENGNYPQIMRDRVAEASERQGLNSSRLRPFTEDQIEYIKGSADFLGLNHYRTQIVYRNESVNDMYVVPSVDDDLNVGTYVDPSWPECGFNHVRFSVLLAFAIAYLLIKSNWPCR